MADTDCYPQTPEMPPQRLVTENQRNPSKFGSHFLYKALTVAIVLVVIPLFPSEAPEFINQTIFTRSWELLHLLVVGIAVSYGLFSRRNVETEKENQLKADSTQAYMSRILQVSNVFDDDLETPFSLDDNNNKTQTWNSKYFRGNPVVVEETPLLDEEHSATISNVSSRPLFLPVRSLRSAVSNSDSVESVGESILSRSGSGAKGSSSGRFDKARSKEFDDVDCLDLEEKLKESVVLPSPIPWRSRSGRMEVKEEAAEVSPPPYLLPPSCDEPGEFESFPSPIPRSSQPNSTSPPKKKASPSPSRSPEKRAKNIEDLGRKKRSSHNSSPPTPPPLPTPPNRKCPSPLSRTRSVREAVSSDNNVVKTFKDELKDYNRSGREDFPRRTDFEMDYLKSEVKPNSHFEATATPKSVRTIRGGEPIAEAKKPRESEERADGKSEKRSKAFDREIMDKPRRKSGGANPQFSSLEKQNAETLRPSPKPTLPKYQKRKNKRLPQKVIHESEEYSSSEADESEGNSDTGKAASDSVGDAAAPDPNEVDKKADEFIAKFREQIRLQRIESIKKSSGQYSRIS